jgi:phasin
LLPAAIRGLLERTGVEAKENYEKLNIATDQMTDVVATSYSSVVKGGTDYGLKVIHMTRLNASAAFDLFGKLVAVKSQSEAIELSTVHARQQFDAVSTQSRELWNSLRRSRLT